MNYKKKYIIKEVSKMIKDKHLSREKYKESLEYNQTALLTRQEHKQTSYCRYALQDYLQYEFKWDYLLTVVFGYYPLKELVTDALRTTHYRFDRWLLTNNKLKSIPVDSRSHWVCIPEYGTEGHLHFNIFIKHFIKPDKKTYLNEWGAVRTTFKGIFKTLKKSQFNTLDFDFHLKERGFVSQKEMNKILSYNTKEIRQQNINEKGKDNFADIILSWKEWVIVPINSQSPKFINKLPELPSKNNTLERFMV